jgi:hypothetical protein
VERELKSYIKNATGGGKDPKFSLLSFLSDIGLPAQTIGADNKGSSEAILMLSKDDLKYCQ